jgi:hypothetical protein
VEPTQCLQDIVKRVDSVLQDLIHPIYRRPSFLESFMYLGDEIADHFHREDILEGIRDVVTYGGVIKAGQQAFQLLLSSDQSPFQRAQTDRGLYTHLVVRL